MAGYGREVPIELEDRGYGPPLLYDISAIERDFGLSFQSRDILPKDLDLVKTARETLDQSLLKSALRGSQRVMLPKTLFAHLNETGRAQIGQMPRHARLRQPERVVNIADAQLAARQEMQNAHAGLVGEGFEHAINLEGLHIFVSTNIVAD